jgi:hypothetical protein
VHAARDALRQPLDSSMLVGSTSASLVVPAGILTAWSESASGINGWAFPPMTAIVP